MRLLAIAFCSACLAARAAGVNDGLVAAYDFDGAESGLLPDLSGNGHDGWVQGARPDAGGVSGSAYRFDGNDYVLLGDLGTIPAGTITFWMKADAMENWRIPFSTAYAGWDHCMKFESNSDRVFVVGLGPHVGKVGFYTTNMAAGIWYHVAFAWDARSFHGWLDGRRVFSEPHNGRLNTHLHKVAVGNGYSTAPNRYWKGLIDEVRIYGRALGDAEVAGLSSPETAQAAARTLAASAPERPRPALSGASGAAFNAAANVSARGTGAGGVEVEPQPANAPGPAILRIGFSNDPRGDEDVTEFVVGETLHVRVSDVDLPGRLDETRMRCTLLQKNAAGDERKVEMPLRRDEDVFLGKQSLQDFEPGEISVAIEGLNRRGVFLFRASSIRLHAKLPVP